PTLQLGLQLLTSSVPVAVALVELQADHDSRFTTSVPSHASTTCFGFRWARTQSDVTHASALLPAADAAIADNAVRTEARITILRIVRTSGSLRTAEEGCVGSSSGLRATPDG